MAEPRAPQPDADRSSRRAPAGRGGRPGHRRVVVALSATSSTPSRPRPRRSTAEPDEVRERWEASPIRRSGVGVEEQLAQAAEAGDLVAAVTDEDGPHPVERRRPHDAPRRRGGRVRRPGAGGTRPRPAPTRSGLALLTGRPATVFSAEHWCESVHDWVCWSVPVPRPRRPPARRDRPLRAAGTRATPVAELAVAALGRLVEEHLPDDAAAPRRPALLRLACSGTPRRPRRRSRWRSRPARSSCWPRWPSRARAASISSDTWCTATGRVSRPPSRPSSRTSGSMLGGGIGSRPYRLTMPVRVDVVDAAGPTLHVGRPHRRGRRLRRPAPARQRRSVRHRPSPRHRRVAARTRLLDAGTAEDLLRFAEVHRYDEAVIERALALAGVADPARHEAEARLEVARQG